MECYLKRKAWLYTDDGYIDVMKTSRQNNPFEVNRMSSDDFLSSKLLEKATTNRKVDINKQKINWLQTHEILLEKSEPTIIKMRPSIGGDFQIVNIAKGRAGGNQELLKSIKLETLWPEGKALSKEKIKDIKELLALVPPDVLPKYSFLGNVQVNDFIDDVDGFGEVIDFEIERED